MPSVPTWKHLSTYSVSYVGSTELLRSIDVARAEAERAGAAFDFAMTALALAAAVATARSQERNSLRPLSDARRFLFAQAEPETGQEPVAAQIPDVRTSLDRIKQIQLQEAFELARSAELGILSAAEQFEGRRFAAGGGASTPAAPGAAVRRLTSDQETDIRVRLSRGESKASLARKFGVSRPTISLYEAGGDRGTVHPPSDPFGRTSPKRAKK